MSSKRVPKNLKTTEQVIKDFDLKHNGYYDYSLVNYINCKTKVKIICPIHGCFLKTPSKHLFGQGCPKCTINKISLLYRKSNDEFLEKAKLIHGDKYDYSKVNYINNNTKIKIICPEHGEFEQLPTNHLSGKECIKCSYELRGNNYKKTKDEFIVDAKLIHGNKYDYSNVVYENCKKYVNITCKLHGDFKQTPDSHIQGLGCPKCTYSDSSKSELEILEFIKTILPNINIISNSRSIIPPLELDIFIPSHNIAIEFNGLYWHNELFKDKGYHLNKTKLCEDKDIQLIHIFEDEWMFKQDIVKSRLKNILGKTDNKIYARKTDIREVSSEESRLFLDDNHIQGSAKSSIKLGLYYEDELVSLMTFCHNRKIRGKSTFELNRFCNKLNTNVIGAASKLLQYFIKNYSPKEILSYADRRWSKGDLYDKLGFDLIRIGQPSYSYIIGYTRKHKSNYKKLNLIKQGYDKDKSEHNIMLDRRIYRIYDCGVLTYKKIILD